MSKTFLPEEFPEIIAYIAGKQADHKRQVIEDTVTKKELTIDTDLPQYMRDQYILEFCESCTSFVKVRDEVNLRDRL